MLDKIAWIIYYCQEEKLDHRIFSNKWCDSLAKLFEYDDKNQLLELIRFNNAKLT